MRTRQSLENIVALSDIRERRLRASSPFGPVRAGSTTSQRTDAEAQLLELLNSLESAVEHLNYKSFTAYATLAHAIEGVRAALYYGTVGTGGTDE